ncbi:MAG: hypothetical protein ABFD50_00520, partial [Smithella sp.]
MYPKHSSILFYVLLFLLVGMPDSFPHKLESVCNAQNSDISGMIKAGNNSFYRADTYGRPPGNSLSKSKIKLTAANSNIQTPNENQPAPQENQAPLETGPDTSQQTPPSDQIPSETEPEKETGQSSAEPGKTSKLKKPEQNLPAVSISPSRGKKSSLSAKASRKRLVTLNFDDADVFTIIQTIFGEVLK